MRCLVTGATGYIGGRLAPRLLDEGYEVRCLVREALDFWRVEEIEPGRLLRLRAEMKVPGLAWLEMTVEPVEATEYQARYRQRAVPAARPRRPRGLAGHAYWWSVAPFHGIVFGGMVRNIVRTAERQAGQQQRMAVKRSNVAGRPAAVTAVSASRSLSRPSPSPS